MQKRLRPELLVDKRGESQSSTVHFRFDPDMISSPDKSAAYEPPPWSPSASSPRLKGVGCPWPGLGIKATVNNFTGAYTCHSDTSPLHTP